jgi:transposase
VLHNDANFGIGTLDQDARQTTGRVGQHSAQAQSKGPICFSPYLYRARNLVERFFNKIYDKLAANYLVFVKLAAIRIGLRTHEFTP